MRREKNTTCLAKWGFEREEQSANRREETGRNQEGHGESIQKDKVKREKDHLVYPSGDLNKKSHGEQTEVVY